MKRGKSKAHNYKNGKLSSIAVLGNPHERYANNIPDTPVINILRSNEHIYLLLILAQYPIYLGLILIWRSVFSPMPGRPSVFGISNLRHR